MENSIDKPIRRTKQPPQAKDSHQSQPIKRTIYPSKLKPKKSRFAGKVAKNLKESRKVPNWLNRARKFKHCFKLKAGHRQTIENFLDDVLAMDTSYKREQKIADLELLLCNLFRYGKNKPISISRNRNDWMMTIYNKTSPFIINLMDAMAEQGFIEMKKGYKTKKESRMARIWSTDKLFDYFEILPEFIEYKPINLIELKKWKGKYRKNGKKLYEPIEYKETNKTLRVRKILKQANEVNAKADIRLDKKNKKYKVNAFLVAIYLESFSSYGRLHTKGNMHYQGLNSEDERPYLIINGNKTVELDFKGLHPNLLYAAEGVQLDKDPYRMAHSHPHARPFLKIILLAMINAEDFNKAQAAANYWFFYNANAKKEELKALGIDKAKPLMEAMIKAHPAIKHYFCSGSKVAMRFMNKDAEIALDIINHFTKKNIPILSIHDSFIVEEQYEAELEEVMKSVYKKHTKGFKIEVTKNIPSS